MVKNGTTDIELLAGLSIDSSEQEILRAIKIIQKRIKANSDARFKLNVEIDETVINNTITKLQNALKNKDLKIETQDSIIAITKEANAMLDVVDSARKATQEKLEFTKANRQVRNSADDTADAINRERVAMENLDDIDVILQNLNMNGRQGNSVFQQFGATLREAFSTYTVANLLQDALYKVVDAGKEALDTVKQFDDINVDLQMATGADKDYVKGLISDYAELGGELGALTETVAESADTFLRQGRSMEETNQLIEDAIVLSKVAKTEGAKASEILTATINGFQLAASEGSRVNDVLSSIDLNSASSAEGIGEALTKVASMANNAGVSLEKTAAMIATIKDVTQDADTTIGTSLKTVLSRMNQIRAGKFIDEESGEALNDVEKVLGAIGVSMRDVNGQFKEAEAVIDEVGTKWKTLDSNTQKAVTTAMGGVYQSNKLVSLFDNYDKVIELTKVAEESAGTALQKFNDSYLPSLEAKTNALKSSLQSLATTTISDEFYGSVLDSTKAIVDMTTETGILKGTLAGLATAGAIYTFRHLTGYLQNATQEFANLGEAMQITRNANGTITDIQRLIDLTGGLSESQTRLLLSTNNLTDAQKVAILMNQGLTREQAEQTIVTWGVATAQQGATGATITWNNALRGLWATLMANPLILVTVAVTAAATAFNKYKQSQEDAIRATKQSAEESAELSEELSDLVSKYISLSDAVKDDESAKEDLLDVQNDLVEKLGLEADNLDTLIEKYGSLDEAIKNATLSKLHEARHDLVSGYDVAVDELLDAGADKLYKNQWTVYSKQNKEALEILNKKGIGRVTDDYVGDTFYLTGIDSTVEGVLKNYKQLGDALSALEEVYGAENVTDIGLYNDLYTRYNELKGFIESYQDSVDELNENAASSLRLTMLKEVEFPDTSEEIETFKQGMLEAALVSKNFVGTQADIERAINSAMDAFTSYSGAESILGTETDNDSDLKIAMSDKQSEAFENYKSLISDISKVYADYENLSKTDIMNMFSDSGYDFTNFMKGTESLNATMQKLADQGLKSVTTAFGDMEGAEQILHDLEQSALGLASNAFGWSENVGHINTLENLLAEIQKGEPLEQQIVDEIRKNYKLNAISLDGGYTFDEEAVQDLLNDFSEDYNESLAKFRVFMRDVMGFSEEGINNFFGKYVYRIIPDSNSGSEKNATKDFSESIDWAAQTVSNLEENLSDLETTLDNTKGWEDQKQAIDDIIDAQEKLKSAYEQSEIMYSSKYQSSLRNGIIAEQGLTNVIREKIESDELFAIEPFVDEIVPDGADEDTKEQLYNAIQEAIDWYNKSKDAENNKIQIGFEIDEKELTKLDIDRKYFDSVQSSLESERQKIQNQIDLNGGQGTAEQYQDLIDNEEKLRESISKRLEMEQDILERLEPNTDAYEEQLERIRDCEDGISDCTKNTKDWGAEILRLPLQEIEDTIDGLNSQLEATQGEMDEMDVIIAGAQAYIQDQIDAQEELKDGIQDQIDALQEANDEHERALALEKAKYELERAWSQRVVKQYAGEGKGFIYTPNREAIRDAQENLDQLEYEEAVHQLEKQIEYYDDIIADLQEIQDAWGQIASNAQDFLDIQKTIAAVGVNGIFSMDVVNGYTDVYTGMLKTQESLENEIDALEDLQESLEDVIELYNTGEITFEECLTRIDTLVANTDLADSEKLSGTIAVIKSLYDQMKQDIASKNAEIAKDSESASNDAKDAVIADYEAITKALQEEIAAQKLEIEGLKTTIETMYSSITESLGASLNTFSQTVTTTCDTLDTKISAVSQKVDELTNKANDLDTEQISGADTRAFVGGGKKPFTMVQLYHDGLENGLVGEKDSGEAIKTLGLSKLSPDEVPALLKVNEAVLTEAQQKLIMDNFGMAYKAGVNSMVNNIVPRNNNTTPVVQNVTVNCPNLTGESGFNEFKRQLEGLQLKAIQYANKR